MYKLAFERNDDGRMQQAVAIPEKQSVGKSLPARKDKLKPSRVAWHLEDRLADDRVAGFEGSRKPHAPRPGISYHRRWSVSTT